MSDVLAGLAGEGSTATQAVSTVAVTGTPVPPATTAAAPAAAEVDGGKDHQVPFSRFREVTEERSALKDRVAELEAAEQERQRAAMSEQERLQADAQRFQTDAEAAANRALLAERSMDAWKAAHAAGFRQPDDAVAFLRDQLGNLEGDKLTAAITALAEERPYLVGAEAPAKPQGFGTLTRDTPAPVKVGADGQPDERAALGADLMKNLFGR